MNIINISDMIVVSFRAIAKVVCPGLPLLLVVIVGKVKIVVILVIGDEYFKGVRGVKTIFKENVLIIPLLYVDELEIIIECNGLRGTTIGRNEVCGNNGNIASVDAIETTKGISVTTISASGTDADDVIALFEIDTGGPAQVIDKGDIPLTIEQETESGNAIGTRREYDVPLIEDFETINRRHFERVCERV